MGFRSGRDDSDLEWQVADSVAAGDWTAAEAKVHEGAGSGYLQKFRLYETRSKFYMIGRDKSRRLWRVLTIDRLEPYELNIREDPTVYSEIECIDLLQRIHDGNRYKRLLCTVDLTKDFFFSYSYNIMHSLQKNACNGETGQVIYETMFVWNEFLTRGIRNHLKNTIWTVALVYGFFNQAKLSISGKDFRLTLIARRSRHFAGTRFLKRGVNEKGRVANDVETEQIVFEDMPGELPTQITSVIQNRGSIPLFWSQETSRLNIRPDIILHKKDQTYEATRLHFDNLVKRYGNPIIILNLIKTREKKPRESLLRAEFAHAIDHINKDLPEESRLRFLHWDLQKHSRRKGTNVLALLGQVAAYALDLTGFFYCQVTPGLTGSLKGPIIMKDNAGDSPCSIYDSRAEDVNIANGSVEDKTENSDISGRECPADKSKGDGCCLVKPPLFQKGVLRTNCVDCLDRTNVAQYAYGLAALGHQLHALGFIDVPRIDLDAPLAADLMVFYERMGDTLALQYGGSAAHNKSSIPNPKGKREGREGGGVLRKKIGALSLPKKMFLGHFQPQQGKPALWELDSDQHYNIGRHGHAFADENARSFIKRSLSDGNILCEGSASVSSCTVEHKELLNSALPPRMNQQGGAKGLCDSTPEISTCESDVSYSRYTPVMSRRLLFADREHSYFNEHRFDEANCSNFLDLDWLSSSGNSCEEETFERSSLINSPIENLSTENVMNDVNAETREEGSGNKGKEETNSALPSGVAEISGIPDDFSERFAQWVDHGGTLCY
ncbi:Phosphoinositide phosphatase SAC3 [Cocos nucifera]|uniref:Phosphoinositide phosphatase SAC3 n=1 Tax=Cocos nucifera TaxID=13894 RepID=A0A8K0N1Z1_COCNU|nr:Phosphoinositide phosphatase SAC3 [Cocos nucifera]